MNESVVVEKVTVTHFVTDLVRYENDFGGGFLSRKWFPGVEVGQKWLLYRKGNKTVKTERIHTECEALEPEPSKKIVIQTKRVQLPPVPKRKYER